jgi:hypothetical protein
MKDKKKAREKIKENGVDISKPFNFTLLDLGGPNDPCFGTHDPQDGECQSCGDSEFCQLAKSQKNHVLRGKQEKTTKFRDKDIEEHPEFNEAKLLKAIKARHTKGYTEKKCKSVLCKKFTPYLSKFLVETEIEKYYGKNK